MSGHFSLDVNPESLRAAVRTLNHLASTVETKGGAVERTPGEIGEEWTGDAATSIKAEMTGLGAHMKRFAPKFTATKEAVSSLADDYDEALAEVGRLNERYAQADRDYQSEVAKADRSYDDALAGARGDDGRPPNRAVQEELGDIRGGAVSAAADARQETRHNLEYSFAMTRQWLAQQTRACAARLVDAAPLPVPPEAVSSYRADGTFPVRLDRSRLEQGMELTSELNAAEVAREMEERGREVAEELRDSEGDVSPELAAEIREHGDNPHFARGLASELDPTEITPLLETLRMLRDAAPDEDAAEDYTRAYDDLVVGLGTTIATATRGEGDLALPDDYADRYADAMTAPTYQEDGEAPPNQAQLLGLLLEQGVYGTEFLDTVAERLYEFERDADGEPVWGPKRNHLNEVLGPDGMPRIDVMASLMKALEHNPEAAQGFFSDPGGPTVTLEVNGAEVEVSERMKYLIVDRTWSHMTDPTNGGNLGGALEAATTTVRDQTSDGRTSAELASELFLIIGGATGDDASGGLFGLGSDDGWQMWDGMRESVADIAGSYAPDMMRVARTGDADDLSSLHTSPEEEFFGEGAPYGAALDPEAMQAVLGALAEEDEHIERVLAGVGAATHMRMSQAFHDALGDGGNPPAPVAMLLGQNIPEVTTATNESAGGLAWVLNAAYHGRLSDEELERKQAEARAALFDTVTSLPGVGPAGEWSKFVFDQATSQIKDQIGKVDTTASEDYSQLSADEKANLERMVLNQILAQGYLDQEYFDQANGGPDSDRYQPPPPGAVLDGDPPRFDFDSEEYQQWYRDRFPYDEFLNSNVFPDFTENLNAGVPLGGG